jgi:biopolymer transport protein TolR
MASHKQRGRNRKRPMAEMNVVPYIDVMLVLLVIFMVTAPLLTQGVRVDLPKASASPIAESDSQPVIVSVDAAGRYYLSQGDDAQDSAQEPLASDRLIARVSAYIRLNPGVKVLVRGDAAASYGDVVGAMVLLQKAGAAGVGLVTENPSS